MAKLKTLHLSHWDSCYTKALKQSPFQEKNNL